MAASVRRPFRGQGYCLRCIPRPCGRSRDSCRPPEEAAGSETLARRAAGRDDFPRRRRVVSVRRPFRGQGHCIRCIPRPCGRSRDSCRPKDERAGSETLARRAAGRDDFPRRRRVVSVRRPFRGQGHCLRCITRPCRPEQGLPKDRQTNAPALKLWHNAPRALPICHDARGQ